MKAVRKLHEMFSEDTDLFWKEGNRETGGRGVVCVGLQREDGVDGSSMKEMKGVWKGNF